MNVNTVAKAIRAKFKADVADPQNLLVQYDNKDDKDQPEDGIWCRFTILPADTSQASIGGSATGGQMFRTPGICIASLFAPYGSGDDALFALADLIAQKFRTTTYSGVVFRTPGIARVGRAGKWWQVNVTAPWYSDVFAS